MTSFPGSPKVQKGAIVGLDPFNPLASVVVFQYNPDSLSRTLQAQTTAGEQANRSEALRLKGPPQEDIQASIEIDAADQLELADPTATSLGVYPALAALEMLIYPKSSLMLANETLARLGVTEVIAPEAPLALFVWGPRRVLPVRLTGFTIDEQAFDPNLNPIRAQVSLGMRVLTYQDLGLPSVGGALYMAHQVAKEALATRNAAASVPAPVPLPPGLGG